MAGEHKATADTRMDPLLRPRSIFTAQKLAFFSTRNLALAAGPLGTLIIVLVFRSFPKAGDDKSNHMMGAMLGILVWMACWWIMGPIPIAITSLLPLVLLPFFEIMDSDAVAAEYANSVDVLLLGTFILALGIQKYNFHRRVALKILLTSGGVEMNPRFVILGFLAAASFVSMWMSDTVAAVMLIPVAIGLFNNLTDRGEASLLLNPSSSSCTDDEEVSEGKEAVQEDAEEKKTRTAAVAEFGKALILAVTYGTALGGMATLIGSGPNVVLPGFYRQRFPHDDGLNFLNWCKFAFPLSILYVIATWLYLAWYFCPPSTSRVVAARMDRMTVEKDYEALGASVGSGPITFSERVILTEFVVLILLWITRTFGAAPGWGVLFDNFPSDGTVALLGAILLFVLPNKQKEGEMIMDWESCKEISWSVILLVGGGFALSKGVEVSGLSTEIGKKLHFLANVPYYLVTPVTTIILSIVTEFSSNVSVASIFLPILAEVSVATNYHPLLLMVPGTFACNFSYILPSATPPNAIALGSGGPLKIRNMVCPGLFMHLVGLLLISVLTPTLGAYIFGLNVPL